MEGCSVVLQGTDGKKPKKQGLQLEEGPASTQARLSPSIQESRETLRQACYCTDELGKNG